MTPAEGGRMESFMKYRSKYEDVNHIIDKLFENHEIIFDEKMVGFYLYGSLVWGDFDIDTSDIDMLCVIDSEITEEELEKLKLMYKDFVAKNPKWSNRIEVHYAPLPGLKNFRTNSFKMGNISPGEPLHIIDSGMDWIDEWYCVQEYAITLYGMDKEKILPHIDRSEFIQTIRRYALSFYERIHNCKESCYSQAYAILTLCRALYTVKNGEQISKPAAARWAMDYLPEYREVIQSALIWRQERDKNNRDSFETYTLAEKFVKDILERFFMDLDLKRSLT